MMFKSTLLVSALLATVANAAILDNDAAVSAVAASAAQRTRQLKGAKKDKKGKSTDSPTPAPTKKKKGKSSKKSSPTPAPVPEFSTVFDVLVAAIGQTEAEVELELSTQAANPARRRNLASSVTGANNVTATTTCDEELACTEIFTDGEVPEGADCFQCDIVFTGGDGTVDLETLATTTETSIEDGDFTESLNVIVVFEGADGLTLSSSPSAAPSDAPTAAPTAVPSDAPTAAPTGAPTGAPSSVPTTSGTSDAPTDGGTPSGTPPGTPSGTGSGTGSSSPTSATTPVA
jgi:hypothetical protein